MASRKYCGGVAMRSTTVALRLPAIVLAVQQAGAQVFAVQSLASIARALDQVVTCDAVRDGARAAVRANAAFAGDDAERAWTMVNAALKRTA
jgi:hypothetical protein